MKPMTPMVMVSRLEECEDVGVPEKDDDDDGSDRMVDIAMKIDAKYGPRTSLHNLQPRKQ